MGDIVQAPVVLFIVWYGLFNIMVLILISDNKEQKYIRWVFLDKNLAIVSMVDLEIQGKKTQ